MNAYAVNAGDLRLVVGREIRPIPFGYWTTGNHTDEKFNPIGLSITQGKVFGAPVTAGDPVFVVYQNGVPAILDTWDMGMTSKVLLAITGTCRLIKNGSLETNLGPGEAPRVLLGIRPDGRAVHVQLDQASLRGAALVMRSLGCTQAIELCNTRVAVQEGDERKLGNHPVVSLLGADRFEKLSENVIVADFGHGGTDPGAGGLLIQPEKFYTLRYGIWAASHLLDRYQCTVLGTRATDETVSLEDRVELANAAGAKVFVSFHINAGGGTGYEDFISASPSVREVNLQELVHRKVRDRVLDPYGEKDRGQKRENFYVLTFTKMPAVLTEAAFVDYPGDAELIKNDQYLRDMGVAIAEGVAEYLTLRPKEAAPPPAPSVVYRVQCGAFKEIANAQALVDKLKAAGFDAFVVQA